MHPSFLFLWNANLVITTFGVTFAFVGLQLLLYSFCREIIKRPDLSGTVYTRIKSLDAVTNFPKKNFLLWRNNRKKEKNALSVQMVSFSTFVASSAGISLFENLNTWRCLRQCKKIFGGHGGWMVDPCLKISYIPHCLKFLIRHNNKCQVSLTAG